MPQLSDWIGSWSIHRIKTIICTGDDLLVPFTIHNVIKKINKRYPRAQAYYTSYYTRRIRQGLSELVSEGVLSETFGPARKIDGWITETFYTWADNQEQN